MRSRAGAREASQVEPHAYHKYVPASPGPAPEDAPENSPHHTDAIELHQPNYTGAEKMPEDYTLYENESTVKRQSKTQQTPPYRVQYLMAYV